MSPLKMARLRAMLLGFRAVLGVHARRGDPLAQLFSLRPGADPYPIYERARALGDLSRSRLGLYATASHRVSNAVLRDPRFGVDTRAALMDMNVLLRDSAGTRPVHPVDDGFISLDPPRHTRLRRVVAPWFTPRALRDRTPDVERVVARLLDDLAGRTEWNLVDDFAAPLTIRVICDLFGIPTVDYARFARWGAVLGATLDGVRSVAELRRLRSTLVELEAFFVDLVEQRRREPGDDLVSAVVAAHPGGAPLARQDLLATCQLLLLAGFETTVNLLGNAALALLTDDDARERLVASPSLAPAVVEEVLRWDSSVQYTVRAVTEPLTLEGVDLPRDSLVVLLLAGANRDPAVFPAPDRLDLDRPNSHEHLSFAAGAHYCLGAGLARLEAATALRMLFERRPDLRLAGPVVRRPSRNIRGAQRLPVRADLTERSSPAST
jgi:cytochrome P450